MKVIQTIGIGFLLLIMMAACENPTLGINDGAKPAGDGNVIIKLAGASGRTVLPQSYNFSKFDIILQKENEAPLETLVIEDTSAITGDGVAVQLTAGNWTITLKAYQQLYGNSLLAAVGSNTIQVKDGDGTVFVVITLNLLDIDTSVEPGVFSYSVTLPPDFDTAALSLKNSTGGVVLFIEEGDFSGNILLAPGYYDLSVIVTKDGQSAGLFESVHIYSGLESPADIDLSAVEFADRVYIMGTLGGVRLGTIKITSDAAGLNDIETLELDSSSALRSANWIINIPSRYAGDTVYAVQKFNGTQSDIAAIPLEIYGAWDIALSIIPATPALFNVAPWYAELTASGTANGSNLAKVADGSISSYWQSERGEENGPVWLELDFGFNVSVNASRLVFFADSGNDSVLIDEYTVQYWNGVNAWLTLASREQYFEGSTDGSVTYGDFFTQTVNAQKFRWEVSGNKVENAPALIEFGLYQTPDRSNLPDIIHLAQQNHDITLVSTNGEDIQRINVWVTAAVKETYQAAINTAQAVCDGLFSTAQDITDAKLTLNVATTTFNAAKQRGNLDDIEVNDFSVQDGYADKFVITWLREPTYIYRLRMSATEIGGWSQIAQFEADEGSTKAISTYLVTGIGAGETRYFTMQAYQIGEDGLEAGGKNVARSNEKVTMGVPVLSLVNNGPSHHTVSLSWTKANKADAYQIVYSIAGDSTSPHAKEVTIDELTPITGGYTYSFRPNGFDNPQVLGRQITIHVKALNKALRQASNCSIEDVTTTSNDVTTRLVGPAELNAAATQAATADNIKLSWDPVAGAAGYYVFRRQFNLANTAVAGAETVAYYVAAQNDSVTVTSKNIAPGDTTTTKASAAVVGERLTLTDAWMTDSEYNGTYSGYTANYKNQQNDIARGNAYRYFIVPVAASTDTVQFNAGNVPYSITSGGDTIAYSAAPSFEKTGFTVGFGQNVTATKGTYVSGGNVNDGIQITWSAPPLLASAGVTPNYTLYRRQYNGSWETVAVLGTGTSHISTTETSGIVYEYAVGINGSRPDNLGRYSIDRAVQEVNTKGIPHAYGFIQEMVKLQGVSRGEDADANASYGERVTLYNNSNPYYNMGIDGYKTEVMNRNLSANWNELGHVGTAGSPTDATQGILHVNNASNHLKVMRDYKHYHKVRSFVWSNGEGSTRIYCPDPAYTWSNGGQNDYVKWGARQVTTDEYIKITTLFMAHGIYEIFKDSWAIVSANKKTITANGTGTSGTAQSDYSGITPVNWYFTFSNYREDIQARTGDWVTFIALTGKLWGQASAGSAYPNRYGDEVEFDIDGPLDTPYLYTGRMSVGQKGNKNLYWQASPELGVVTVTYPSGTAKQVISYRGQDTALPFPSNGNRHLNDPYK